MKLAVYWEAEPNLNLSIASAAGAARLLARSKGSASKLLGAPVDIVDVSHIDSRETPIGAYDGYLYSLMDYERIVRTSESGDYRVFSESITTSGQLSICINSGGNVICLGEDPNNFDVLDASGCLIDSGRNPCAGSRYFEAPEFLEPFWKYGASSIAASKNRIAIGGGNLERIDIYESSGKYIGSICDFSPPGGKASIDFSNIVKVALANSGQVWATDSDKIYIWTANLMGMTAIDVGTLVVSGARPTVEECFVLDEMDRLWTIIGTPPELTSHLICYRSE